MKGESIDYKGESKPRVLGLVGERRGRANGGVG
jgi:hypothetical protein